MSNENPIFKKYLTNVASMLFYKGIIGNQYNSIVRGIQENLSDRFEQPPDSYEELAKVFGSVKDVVNSYDLSGARKYYPILAWIKLIVLISLPNLILSLQILNFYFDFELDMRSISKAKSLELILTNSYYILLFGVLYYFLNLGYVFNLSYPEVIKPTNRLIPKITKLLLFAPLFFLSVYLMFVVYNMYSLIGLLIKEHRLIMSIAIIKALGIGLLLFIIALKHNSIIENGKWRFDALFFGFIFPELLQIRIREQFKQFFILIDIDHSTSSKSISNLLLYATEILWHSSWILFGLTIIVKLIRKKDTGMAVKGLIYGILFLVYLIINSLTSYGWNFISDTNSVFLDGHEFRFPVAGLLTLLGIWIASILIISKINFKQIIRSIRFDQFNTKSFLIVLMVIFLIHQPIYSSTAEHPILLTGSGSRMDIQTSFDLPEAGSLTILIFTPINSIFIWNITDVSDSKFLITSNNPKNFLLNNTGDNARIQSIELSILKSTTLIFKYYLDIIDSKGQQLEIYLYFNSKVPLFSNWSSVFVFLTILTSLFIKPLEENRIG